MSVILLTDLRKMLRGGDIESHVITSCVSEHLRSDANSHQWVLGFHSRGCASYFGCIRVHWSFSCICSLLPVNINCTSQRAWLHDLDSQSKGTLMRTTGDKIAS